jgi:Domain of unknown function (DUF4258)
MANDNQPMLPANATELINRISKNLSCNLSLTIHAKDRLKERDLLMGDLLHVLRHGYVYEVAEASTLAGAYKYKIEGKTPNSGGRAVRAVVVASAKHSDIKVITVMWRDEG